MVVEPAIFTVHHETRVLSLTRMVDSTAIPAIRLLLLYKGVKYSSLR